MAQIKGVELNATNRPYNILYINHTKSARSYTYITQNTDHTTFIHSFICIYLMTSHIMHIVLDQQRYIKPDPNTWHGCPYLYKIYFNRKQY